MGLNKLNGHREPVDIVIANGIVLTMDSGKTVLEGGSVVIQGGAIIAVKPGEVLEGRFQARETIEAAGKIVMPGLVNTHTHAAMTLFRGLADDLPLQEWLEGHIWPSEAKHMSAEAVRLGTQLAIAEMIRAGTTTFNDMYLFEEEVAEMARQAGIRAVVGEGLLDFPTPNHQTPQEGLQYAERLIEKWRHDPFVTVAVAPHSCYACSPDILKAARALADRHRVPLHIHLSETKEEVAEIRGKYGFTPVAHLENLGVLGGTVVAAHCIHLTEEDMDLIVRRRVGVAHNPESDMKLASGVAPIPALLAAGARVGLGTDGAASNNDLDMFGEMDTAAKIHKVFLRDPTVMDAPGVMEMATMGGARVLGMEGRIGSLEKGKRADVIILDLNRPHLVPLYHPYSQVVYAAGREDVETVIVEGRVVMRGRKLLTIEEEKVIREVRAWAGRIRTNS